jgi:oligoribonuclease (3'-5' exoribonuclease)
MDLEMTGLDPERDVIVEIATLVTDDELAIVAEGPDLVVHHDADVLGPSSRSMCPTPAPCRCAATASAPTAAFS